MPKNGMLSTNLGILTPKFTYEIDPRKRFGLDRRQNSEMNVIVF